MIIAIEGIDGAGKNTLVQALTAAIQADVHTQTFPRYGTMFADLARDALQAQLGDVVDSIHGMALLFALDRQAAREELLQYAEGGAHADQVLLLDRYVASNAAYTAARLNDDAGAQWVAELEFGRFALPKPDLTILLDTPVEVAAQRAQGRETLDASRTRDAYERDGGLQARTAAQYRRLAASEWASPWIVAPVDVDVVELAHSIAQNVQL